MRLLRRKLLAMTVDSIEFRLIHFPDSNRRPGHCEPDEGGRSNLFGLGSNKIKRVPLFSRTLYLKSATTYSPTIAVPSALSGLTSLFGMGRGGTPTL